jgi:abequosyltransferase
MQALDGPGDSPVNGMTTPRQFARPRLSICVATFKRGEFIARTLDSIIDQLGPRVELLVVDGASPDDTAAVVEGYLSPDRPLRYFRESANSGVDADFDKAVGYARGDYCWLMTDDDLLHPGAIDAVLSALTDEPDLVVVNAQVLTPDLSEVLDDRMLAIREDKTYDVGSDDFFAETANYLSFIGAVVVKREAWLVRERETYYGSLFIHVGVLFQSPPLGRAHVIARPLISIRYANAMWTARAFEIWMFKWPALIWSFAGYSDSAKSGVSAREPWKSFRKLIYRRAIGNYSVVEFRKFIAGKASAAVTVQAWFVARLPGSIANVIAGLHCIYTGRKSPVSAYDLSRGRYSTWVSRIAARRGSRLS